MNTSIRTLKLGMTTTVEAGRNRGNCLRWLPVLLAVLGSSLAHTRSHAADFTTPDQLRKQLYYSEADDSGLYPKTNAAFRYKELLYVPESNQVRANFTNMGNLYGNNERMRAAHVEELIWGKLNYGSANDAVYGPLLLDLYYDRAAAEVILAHNILEGARSAHYGPPIASPPPLNGYLIENEIPLYVNALAAYRSVLSNYFTLFTRTRSTLGPPAMESPGTRLFTNGVPTRGLVPASYVTNGNLASVTGDTNALYSGYKDLVLLNGVLRDYGRAAEALARLYLARASVSDIAAAKLLVTEAQRTLYIHGNLLRGLFPSLNPGTIPGSGLAESQAGWEKALSALDQLRQFLDGRSNLLGFAPDFLMLIGKQSGNFDSFDSFKSLLNPGSAQSELYLASLALTNARSAFATYRGFQDELETQLSSITSAVEGRLSQIMGAYPVPVTPLPGSEADQQQTSIAIARLQIERNRVNINNLKQEIQIEINRRGLEQGINNAIVDVQIDYGNQQASLTEEIALIEAKQAGADRIADEANSSNPFGAFFHGANAVYQTKAELDKGQLAASKERLAAKESAAITSLNDQLLDVNSKALIKTKLLDMNKLAIDSQEATLQLTQEQGRLVALAREKANLEATIAESASFLAPRYFADPVHRLAALYQLAQADLQFAEAQKWLFFMVRALEYKWNEPFIQPYAGRSYNTASIFALRNADELAAFYQAMLNFDNNRLSLVKDDYFDWFSIREDFFGYTTIGAPAPTYPDPITGQPVGAIQAFRSRLRQMTNANPGFITLEFSTVRQGGSAGTFFQGPIFNPATGVVIQGGGYLDKIIWMKINLPGSHPTNQVSLGGNLRYGGSSYIRNQFPGSFNPQRRDRLENELTAYSSRYWFFGGGKWQFTEAQSGSVTMTLSQNSQTPPSVQQIDLFAERSVAASRWQLLIPIQGVQFVNISNLNDVEIQFYHEFFTRQP